MPTPATVNKPRNRPYKSAGVAVIVLGVCVMVLVYLQFRGDLTPKTQLRMLSSRAGLVMDAGSKVTYNGVQIGRVAKISAVQYEGKPAAEFLLDLYPKYLNLIPANVDAQIKATTIFGGKYVSLTSPENASSQRITPDDVIDATAVTTEINTLFQTITSIADKVDPVKVNLTLSATADALSGLGDKFGESLVKTNAILDDVGPRLPQARHDLQSLAAVSDTYSNAAPDLFGFLGNAAKTAHTLHAQQNDLDAALLAAAGFGTTAADILNRGGPYLARSAADLVPSAKLLDTYSPELYCTIRNFDEVEPKVAAFSGAANGYSIRANAQLLSGAGLLLSGPGIGLTAATAGLASVAGIVGGAPNPYIYPENLPRINARGGPGGAPGCWQSITRHLWPAPYLVQDTGANLAPYNHLETGSPYAIEYVWGRQLGDNTINP